MSMIPNILKPRSEKNGVFFSKIQAILGFKPKSIKPYEKAFTHRSLHLKDINGNALNYERLEFLGDAMLGSVIAAHLFKTVPHGNEGYLTKMRAKVVSRKQLNELGKELKLIELVRSKTPQSQLGANMHGNLFESLIGAIYLDRGFRYCEKFIHMAVIDPHVDIQNLEGKITSYKSLLIEWCQKLKKDFQFEVYEDTGRGEMKHFAVKLNIDNKLVAKARATSKKKAEEKASKRAYFALQAKIDF